MLRSTRALLRVAFAAVRQHKLQSALVVLMIAGACWRSTAILGC